MEILVTGGAGFIGGHLAEQFVADGHDVRVLDNLDPFYDVGIKEHTIEQCRERAENGEGSYEFVDGDVRDEDDVADAVGAAEFVYHQAAQAGVRPSVEAPRRYDEVNVDGTLNVLDAARAVLGERVEVLRYVLPLVLFGLAAALVVFADGQAVGIWILWGLLTLVFGRAGTATPLDDSPVDWRRKAVGALTLVLGLLCFTPVPIVVTA